MLATFGIIVIVNCAYDSSTSMYNGTEFSGISFESCDFATIEGIYPTIFAPNNKTNATGVNCADTKEHIQLYQSNYHLDQTSSALFKYNGNIENSANIFDEARIDGFEGVHYPKFDSLLSSLNNNSNQNITDINDDYNGENTTSFEFNDLLDKANQRLNVSDINTLTTSIIPEEYRIPDTIFYHQFNTPASPRNSNSDLLANILYCDNNGNLMIDSEFYLNLLDDTASQQKTESNRFQCSNANEQTNNIAQSKGTTKNHQIPLEKDLPTNNNAKRKIGNEDVVANSMEKNSKNRMLNNNFVKDIFTQNGLQILNSNYKTIHEKTRDENPKHSFKFTNRTFKKKDLPSINLEILKAYESKCLMLKNNDRNSFNRFYPNLKQLLSVSERAKKLCEEWKIRNETLLDTENNRNIQNNHLMLATNVYSAIERYKDCKEEKDLAYYWDIHNLKLNKNIENANEYLKLLNSFKLNEMPAFEIPENTLVKSSSNRNLEFIYQRKNLDLNQVCAIPIQGLFYPSFLSVFNNVIYISLYCSAKDSKILKVDLNEQTHQEVTSYTIGEEDDIKNPNYRYASKYSMLRTDSNGNLFMLESVLGTTCAKKKKSEDSFELLVLTKDFMRVASIKIDSVDSVTSKGMTLQPAVVDFAIHTGCIHALNVKSKCIEIYNEKYKNIRSIYFPESLANMKDIHLKDIHLVVSTQYIFISFEKTIYYIKNTNELAAFNSFEFEKYILNIACYNEESIFLRFNTYSSLIKIKENSLDIEHTRLPYIKQLQEQNFETIIIEKNVLYSMCTIPRKVFILDSLLNLANGSSQ